MAALFDPYFQAIDANGLPMSGATLAFYIAGTSTEITIYQDSEATTPHTNPVVADSAGLFPPVFIVDLGYNIKFVLKTQAGVTVLTVDDAPPTPELGAVTSAGYFYGLQLSNDATDPDNDVVIAAGEAASDGSPALLMVLPTNIVKRLDFAWSTGFGGLDTGTKEASKWYHVWLIKNLTTFAVNALFSLSATNPVMPDGWTAKRRIGFVGTDSSGDIRPVVWTAGTCTFSTPFSVVGAEANDGNVQRTLNVPLGVKLRLNVGVYFKNETNAAFFAIKDADNGVATTSDFKGYLPGAGLNGGFNCEVYCNASGQVYTYSNHPDTEIINIYLQAIFDQRGIEYADI